MTKSKDQGTGMRDQEADRMTLLLKSAIPRMDDEVDLPRDLWPAMLRRMDEQSSRGAASVPWFDWALAGSLVVFAAIAPRSIPVILYYL